MTGVDHVARAMLVKNRVDQLAVEARTADPGRIAQIRVEMAVCVDSLHMIREEQLQPRVPKKRWWQR